MKRASQVSKIQDGLILALLPVALALYANSVNIAEIPQSISSGVYPVAFTLLSWGMAIQQLIQIKKK
jgi:hypothetical protein